MNLTRRRWQSSSARSGWCSAAAALRCSRRRCPASASGFSASRWPSGLTLVSGIYALGHRSRAAIQPRRDARTGDRAALPDARRCCPTGRRRWRGASAPRSSCTSSRTARRNSVRPPAGLPRTDMARTRPADTPSGASLLSELVMSFMFVFIVLGTTHATAFKGFAPLAIGLALTLIHLISIPVTNTSVNPARSTGPALFAGGCGHRSAPGSSGPRPSPAPCSQASCTRRSSVT